ncbi:undecaprenyl-phosphate glucose phosphotransferase [Flectobacillus major]|uniref:undecaprenyl-phosphate glucose phosphotransferase n=1 Tax=Flectobacillus major TaxID=103 RepID=UPI00041A3356|nr:undecaprenyl-phosphate glucose phosphotransferase [Flectobacillus major]
MKGLGYYRLLSDFIFIFVSFEMASTMSGRELSRLDWGMLLFLMVAWYFSSKATNLYDDFRTVKFIDEFLLLIPNLMIQMMVLVTAFFMLDDRVHARKFVFLYVGVSLVILTVKKYIAKKIAQLRRLKGKSLRKVLIVGTSEVGMSFYEMINNSHHYGYKVVGFVDAFKPVHLNGMYKGNISEIEEIVNRMEVDEVIVALDKFEDGQLDEIIRVNEKLAVRTRIIPDYFRFNSSRFSIEMFGKYPVVTVRHEPLEYFHWRVLKRAFDIVFSLLVCVFIFSWLFPIIAILIKLDSKGPVLFVQERWGRGSKPIKCFKFRSMRTNAPDIDKTGKFMQAGQDDPRITKVGKFLRKTNLDEFPQFLNVILGDMSVVGPRPHAVKHNIETMGKIDNYLVRHWVKPGITGLAQANGYRGETTDFNLMRKRVHFDIWYIENWTFWLDIKIIFMTAYNMIKGEPTAY